MDYPDNVFLPATVSPVDETTLDTLALLGELPVDSDWLVINENDKTSRFGITVEKTCAFIGFTVTSSRRQIVQKVIPKNGNC